MLSPTDAVAAAAELLPKWRAERQRLDRLDAWYQGRNEAPYAPKATTREYRTLREKSLSPHLALVVTVVVQGMIVDGYRRADDPDDSAPWQVWQANGMDSRQVAIHRGAVALGTSYATCLPGDPLPVMRGVSARKMHAVYADPAEDEWPMVAMRVDSTPPGLTVRVYDDEAVHTLTTADVDSTLDYQGQRVHGLGVVPVVRYANSLDLDGRSQGEVEPLIPIAARIDQTTLDRLIVQRYAAWKVRTVAGMAKPDTDEEREALTRILEVGDLLVSGSPDTRFGTLDGTPLDGFIHAKEADYRELAAVSQTPPVDLLGQVANLSAEALAEARFAAARKRDERKLAVGESHEQLLRLAGHAMGDEAAAQDFAAQVVWRDVESRNLAAVADALGKLAAGLGVPLEMLWEMIPGWTKTDVDRAKTLAAEAQLGAAAAEAAAFGVTGLTSVGDVA